MLYYTVYLAKTDEVVAHGNARECAKQMGKSIDGFYSMCSKTRKGKQCKYIVLQEDDKE